MRREGADVRGVARWRRVALAGMIGLALGGCGRRGPLEPDPASGLKANSATTDERTKDSNQVDGTRRVRGVVPPKQPFILDPIL